MAHHVSPVGGPGRSLPNTRIVTRRTNRIASATIVRRPPSPARRPGSSSGGGSATLWPLSGLQLQPSPPRFHQESMRMCSTGTLVSYAWFPHSSSRCSSQQWMVTCGPFSRRCVTAQLTLEVIPGAIRTIDHIGSCQRAPARAHPLAPNLLAVSTIRRARHGIASVERRGNSATPKPNRATSTTPSGEKWVNSAQAGPCRVRQEWRDCPLNLDFADSQRHSATVSRVLR